MIFAFLLHRYGWLRAGKKAYLASEIVHNLPIMKTVYHLAERKVFDIYEQGLKFVNILSLALYHGFDRSSDWLYERAVVNSGKKAITSLRAVHRGNATQYVAWLFAGALIVAIFVLIF